MQETSTLGHAAFRRVQDAFAQAQRQRPNAVRESYYAFAGQRVRLRIVGQRLADYLGQPFAHLVSSDTPSNPVSLVIDLWDETETAVPYPIGPMTIDLGATRPIDGGVLSVSPGDRFLSYGFAGSTTWLDREAQRIVGWRAGATQLSLHERAKPLPLLLSVWYSDRGIETMHAGLVSRNGHGVLVAGGSGTGKSTCAVACALAGFGFLGDDYVGVQAAGGGSFVGHSLYGSTRLHPEHLQNFPSLRAHAIPGREPDERKSVVLLAHVFPGQLERVAAIRAIVLPRVAAAPEPRVRSASKAQALLALIPSSVLGRMPSPGARGVDLLARLVDHVPAYWLELGRDVGRIPPCVQQVLAEATA